MAHPNPTASTAGVTAVTAAIETHSIDHVPHAERHGRVRDLGALWFVSNVNLTGMATGIAVMAVGASLFWSIVATVLGSLFGSFFMAFHSAQGPQLGLPQLVQSRPQFGYLGAALTVYVFAFVNYVAYNTSDALLSGGALHQVFGIPPVVGYLLAALVAAAIALFGYRWIHTVNKWLAIPIVVLLVLMTLAAFVSPKLDASVLAPGRFELAPFMTVFVVVAGFQLGWAPYVSDYSRYLPATVGVRATFWWTYLSSAVSAVWVFVIGAVAAAIAPKADPVTAFMILGNALFPGFGTVVIVVLMLGLLSIMAINQYGGSLTLISILDTFTKIRTTRALRTATILAMTAIVFGISQFVGLDRFNAFYGNALIFLAYIFTPWTAINLVDYFFVRKGRYVMSEIFNPRGIYGRWGWRGTLAYVITIVVMVPFMVTAPFTGFIAVAAQGVDYSMFVGLPLAGVLYWLFTRNLDLAKEDEMVDAEGILTAHGGPAADEPVPADLTS